MQRTFLGLLLPTSGDDDFLWSRPFWICLHHITSLSKWSNSQREFVDMRLQLICFKKNQDNWRISINSVAFALGAPAYASMRVASRCSLRIYNPRSPMLRVIRLSCWKFPNFFRITFNLKRITNFPLNKCYGRDMPISKNLATLLQILFVP